MNGSDQMRAGLAQQGQWVVSPPRTHTAEEHHLGLVKRADELRAWLAKTEAFRTELAQIERMLLAFSADETREAP